MRLSITVLSLLLAAENAVAGRYHGYISPYSFDSNYLHAPIWMTALPDSTNLTSLSIPGTHDTMTNEINGPVMVNSSLSVIDLFIFLVLYLFCYFVCPVPT